MQCGRNVPTFEEHNGLPLKTEAVGPSEMSVRFYHPIGRDTPPDGSNAHIYRHGNLQCHKTVTDSKAKRDEVTGEWRKLHNEELSDLYSLPNIVRVVKSRRMR